MKLPKVENPAKYAGLYVVDFGDQCGVGFTANEVAELLESEKTADIKVYKIHNAKPDGTMELKGVVADTFRLEAGMFFYASDAETSRNDYKKLVTIGANGSVPGKAKVHLAQIDDQFVTALIYPAEFDDEFSGWLLKNEYRTDGPAAGGVSAVRKYYDAGAEEVLESSQFFAESAYRDRSGSELLESCKRAIQR